LNDRKLIPQAAIASAVIIGFLTTLAYLLHLGADKEIILMMVGALIGGFSQATQYYLGSSAGSAHKTDIAAQNAARTAVAAEVAKAVVNPPEKVTPAVSASIARAVVDAEPKS